MEPDRAAAHHLRKRDFRSVLPPRADTDRRARVLEMLARNVLSLPFRLEDHGRIVRTLMRKDADVPMSLADACLVRLAEVTIHSTVLTLNRDFKVYRKHGRQVIPLIIPR